MPPEACPPNPRPTIIPEPHRAPVSKDLKGYHQSGFIAPATASTSAASLPGSLLCPLTQVNWVGTPRASRALSSSRIATTRSLFLTGPALDIHPFRCQFMYHSVTHEMAYLLSVRISSGEFASITSRLRRMAVSSARWFVCSLPWSRSEMFLFGPRQ
ncbi:hypothetical protein QBC39DRAFT_31664 [Podospora conica]|nr:hypothetical protein QBC39DRAFT_31664 [Schizothecium conicum]